ncbi:MAG TPA: hypothetical protein VE992_07880 [Solirubrobacteraceae bacterium]|nr:hypothetical protein [Solirubrobacteraceae bacterium]
MIVQEVAARAWLANPGRELSEARDRAEDGDPDWTAWVDEFDRGEAILADLAVSVTVRLEDGSAETAAVENHGIWLPVAVHPPALAAMVAEIASKDFDVLATRIAKVGARITANELGEMHVAVELDQTLLSVLRPPVSRTQGSARPGITTENA